MIPFEEIDTRLAGIGKNRAWLAEMSGRSPSSLRSALAPNAAEKQRSSLLQKALTDAIEGEERRQREGKVGGIILPDRITIEASAGERREWQECSLAARLALDVWAVAQLNEAARKWRNKEEGNRDAG
jgi:hypothetical protein